MIFIIGRTCEHIITVSIIISLSGCTNNADYDQNSSLNDTIGVIQTVLSDNQLESEISNDFGDEQFKLTSGPFTKIGQPLTFAGKPVRIVKIRGNPDEYELHQHYPKGLYASVTYVRFFPPDSATTEFVFHAGNGTNLFYLTRDKQKWIIRGRQYGKF